MFKLIKVFSFLCYLVFCVISAEYDNEDRMYLMVSPDQHEHTPRLEDFFWTGSGDGPPPPPDPPLEEPLEPSTPIVKTTTVLATVYLDSYPPQAVTDKTTGECVMNCGEPVIPGSLEPEIPEDRRYWLLTVIQGSTPDSLQLKLARLYQKAFLRQQERHLGIIKSLDAPTTRKKHDVHSFVVNKDNNLNTSPKSNTPLRYLDIQSSILTPMESVPASKVANDTRKPKIYSDNFDLIPIDNIDATAMYSEIKPTLIQEVESWILATPTVVMHKREIMDKETMEEYKEELIDIPLEDDTGNETTLFKREIIKPEQQPPVEVHIQNITEYSETGSVQIVYVVLVGGRAVPAAVAARDMRLVRDAEVAKELGAVVTTKAEPYLKAAEGLEGEAAAGAGVRGAELWALAVGASIAVLLILALIVLLCLAHRKKTLKSAESLRAYRHELMREAERNQLKQVHEEKDGKLISVVSPSRTRPSSTLLPVYRANSSGSSTSSSGVSEVAAALRRRQKKPHALRMPQKKRVGTTDSLLEAAGLDSSDSGQPSAPQTPTSYLSMPSVNSFPRGNIVEPLSRILEPVSVRHLDIDSPVSSPKDPRPKTGDKSKDVIPRRQMASQLVRLGSIDKDPGVIGPLVWDLHCQRIKDASKPPSPAKSTTSTHKPGPSRMRQRFNELMDDAFTLFGSAGSIPNSHDTFTVDTEKQSGVDKKREGDHITQARNDNVRLPGSPYTALDTVRGKSAGPGRAGSVTTDPERPRTSYSRTAAERRAPPPARAWGPTPPHSLGTMAVAAVPAVNPAIILAEGRLAAEDPAIPLISAIKSEIERMRDQAHKSYT
ncbi:uncharacterized protein LOC126375463 isoform X2 [Pectinophora gossypiella]|uniref:uncharacterized protein LOC126375463 isoform X2 n=1 Tax=Pectinophora gossypiella TaxID=13191 RepID=UPI00214ED22A|nr:uncharacterized protein LOC126375463 isoform X2 [Pectinophora gossypiella]